MSSGVPARTISDERASASYAVIDQPLGRIRRT
jgi:hypothetical protein